MIKFGASLTAFAVITASFSSTQADSNEVYVSTEEIERPFGEESEDYSETHTNVFPIVKYDKEGDDSKLRVLHVPFVTVFRSKKNEDRQKVEVVDIPFFKLASTESEANGEFDNKFLKVPIFGSLFRHKRQGDREKIRFLFFSHTLRLDPDEYGQNAFSDKPERRQSRGKGARRKP